MVIEWVFICTNNLTVRTNDGILHVETVLPSFDVLKCKETTDEKQEGIGLSSDSPPRCHPCLVTAQIRRLLRSLLG